MALTKNERALETGDLWGRAAEIPAMDGKEFHILILTNHISDGRFRVITQIV